MLLNEQYNFEYFRINYQTNANDQYQRRIHSMIFLLFRLLPTIQEHHHQSLNHHVQKNLK